MVFLVQILKADELRPGQGNVVMLVAGKLKAVKPHRIAVQRDHIKGVRSLVGAAFGVIFRDAWNESPPFAFQVNTSLRWLFSSLYSQFT